MWDRLIMPKNSRRKSLEETFETTQFKPCTYLYTFLTIAYYDVPIANYNISLAQGLRQLICIILCYIKYVACVYIPWPILYNIN